MRKTKIVCTLGPATDRDGVLGEMIGAGMDVARFNFSHGDHDEHLGRFTRLKAAREAAGKPVAALMDTRGPEIRLGDFDGGKAHLKKGQEFILTPRDVLGDASVASITYKNLWQDVSEGCRILLDDGLIGMVVHRVAGEEIICRVENGGPISNHKGVNVPGVHLSMPYIGQADRTDLIFAVQTGFDLVAASFTRSAADILDLKKLLGENGGDGVKIIAKIENREGVDNIDEILAVADGIMVARGDMGVEIDFTEIPILQKRLIEKCYRSGRPVITATQMLESMMGNPRPTRAEITDVANAIYDGTSALMLSGETAAGRYPVESVRTMAAIALRTESEIPYAGNFSLHLHDEESRMTVTGAVAHATCDTAIDTGAAAILTVTCSGETARQLSRHRPPMPIIACVMDDDVCRQLSLSWGVVPIVMPYANSTDEMISLSVAAATKAGLVADGDLVIITAGLPVGIAGTTNMLKAHLVGDALVSGAGVGLKNAVGNVCVVANLADAKAKFHPGDVLVANFTTNDLLGAMKEAAAVITEEGGMGSHAAIVGLTLEKPVIVGAVGAMQKLRDGMRVSVDAEHGIVREMPD